MEGDKGAVLHTGDFRAERWFLDSIVKEPGLQKYLAVSLPYSRNPRKLVTETLEAIYLDTACLLNENEPPSKVRAYISAHYPLV